jgi:anti-anti-sigma regulatory factor
MQNLNSDEECTEAVKLECCSTGTVLHLTGSITVSQATQLHKSLLMALDSKTDIGIDFTEVTDLDLSAIQLLCAAQRKASRARLRFFASTPVPEVSNERFLLAGVDLFSESKATHDS